MLKRVPTSSYNTNKQMNKSWNRLSPVLFSSSDPMWIHNTQQNSQALTNL